jgi:hypothetical protein
MENDYRIVHRMDEKKSLAMLLKGLFSCENSDQALSLGQFRHMSRPLVHWLLGAMLLCKLVKFVVA